MNRSIISNDFEIDKISNYYLIVSQFYINSTSRIVSKLDRGEFTLRSWYAIIVGIFGRVGIMYSLECESPV